MNETTLLDPIFQLSSNVLLLFINAATFWKQKQGCFRIYISHQKSSYVEPVLHSLVAANVLNTLFWIHCSRIFKKSHWKRSLLVTLFVCCFELMYRYLYVWKLSENLFSISSGGPLLKNVKQWNIPFIIIYKEKLIKVERFLS